MMILFLLIYDYVVTNRNCFYLSLSLFSLSLSLDGCSLNKYKKKLRHGKIAFLVSVSALSFLIFLLTDIFLILRMIPIISIKSLLTDGKDDSVDDQIGRTYGCRIFHCGRSRRVERSAADLEVSTNFFICLYYQKLNTHVPSVEGMERVFL